MNHAQKIQYRIWVAFLIVGLAYFWIWWLRPEHNIGAFSYVLNLIVIAWLTLLPLYFILILSRARVPAQLPVPAGYRVAMVVTKAPSEPFPIVQETLEAMLRQTYPHDTWLADEDPALATIEWCREHGVMISTRKDRPDYHNSSWPRRTKCKEGNLAFFYDHYGYANYDFVVQLDADHVPTDGYLEEMLRGFADPKVGYVSAPSICDKNAEESWSARGRLYVEGALHGALQAGYTGDFAPMCIGSHYAVRTIALREIGGLGPELAEDHSTTLMMNANGWRGVHALNAIAHGAGPQTFGDLATQEFQWSRSLFTILLKYTPLYFGKLTPRLKLQFAFCQLWYPLFSLIMLVVYLLPLTALLLDLNMVGINYPEFFVRISLIWIILTGMALWWSKHQWTRPVQAKVLSWEGTLFLFARWPWSLIGMIAAMRDWMLGSTLDFRVTPKGRDAAEPLPLRVLAPYAFLSLASGLPVLFLGNIKVAVGFYMFATLNSILYAVLLVVIVLKHRAENPNASAIPGPNLYRVTVTAVAAVTIAIPLFAIPLRGPIALKSLVWGYEHLLERSTWQKGLPTGVAGAWSTTASAQPLAKASKRIGPVRLGVYDPEQVFSAVPNLSVEHIFLHWQDFRAAQYRSLAQYAAARHRQLMVTIEPWTRAKNWTDGGEQLLKEVIAGNFDPEIKAICLALGATAGPVLVRWGHEMEDDSGRYPWANREPKEYIAAYQHFVDQCRKFAPEANFIWSPQGKHSLALYYPGDGYVDFVGISLYALQAWDIDHFGKDLRPSEVLGPLYARVEKFEKLIIIPELGVAGDYSYRKQWLGSTSELAEKFDKLFAVIYFNSHETGAWPAPYGSPDWRITPDDLMRGP
jgi:cellulose synthase (UDP-forming)